MVGEPVVRAFFRDTLAGWASGLVAAAVMLRWLPDGWYQTVGFGLLPGLSVGLAQSRHLGAFVPPAVWIRHSVITAFVAFMGAVTISTQVDRTVVNAALIGAGAGLVVGYGQVTSILLHVRRIGRWLGACAAALGVTYAAMVALTPRAEPGLVMLTLGGVLFATAQSWLFGNLVDSARG